MADLLADSLVHFAERLVSYQKLVECSQVYQSFDLFSWYQPIVFLLFTIVYDEIWVNEMEYPTCNNDLL